MITERTGAVLIAALLVLSSVGSVATATTAGGTGDGIVAASDSNETELNETVSKADEAYVMEDGSVVVVYNHDQPDDAEEISGHARMNVSDGVAEFVMSQDAETDATGNLTLLATPDEMTADGALVTDRPDVLTDLRFELDSIQNRTVSESEMALNSTVTVPEDSDAASIPQLLQGAHTRGTITTDATSLTATGSAGVQLLVLPVPDRSHEIVLTEDDGSYTLSVDESYVLEGENATDGWETREEAKATLEEQYCEGVNTTGVTCEVSLDSYDLTEEGEDSQRLSVAYTVTAEGVDAVVSEMIVEGLTGPETNTTEAEATELADRIENVTLSRIEAEMVVGGGQANVSWNVNIDGTDDLTLAYVDLLEQFEQAATTSPQAPDTDLSEGLFGTSTMIDQIRGQTEARRAAGLETTTSWEFALTTDPTQGTINLDGTAASETTNWADYVAELDDRDINITDSSRTTLDVRTDGDRIVAEGSASVEDEGMFDRALTEYEQAANESEVTQMIEAIRAADFEHARLDASVADGTVTVEGEISVGDGPALSEQLPEPFSMMRASETDFDAGYTAVLMDSDVDSEDAVRELSFVGEETEIKMPGEWDAEEQPFSSLVSTGDTDDDTDDDDTDDDDTDDGETTTEPGTETTDEDETEPGTETTEDTGDGDGPGFGIVAALIAVAGGAAIAGRRLREST
ncbi:MAG: hypothetical protein V5A34_12230 [Halapricum sp.]